MMTKAEAAEILVPFINTRARHYGVRQVTKDFIETIRTEALSYGVEGNRIRKAAETCPHWTTIRDAGRAAAGR